MFLVLIRIFTIYLSVLLAPGSNHHCYEFLLKPVRKFKGWP